MVLTVTGTWNSPKGGWKGTQASGGLRVGEQPEHEVEVVESPSEDPELAHVQEALDALRGAGRLALFRKKPTWCAGYLTTIELGPNEEIDLAQIKADWGGGEIQFRPQKYTSNGVRFAPGGRTLRFTGPPRENGLEITPDGLGLRQQQPGAVVIHDRPPAVRPAPDQTMPQLVGMLMQSQSRMFEQFLALFAAQRTPPPTPAADPLAQLTASIRAYKQLDTLFGPEETDEGEPPPEDVPPWLGRLLDKAMDRWDGKRPQQPPQQQQQQQQQQQRSSWRLHKSPQQQPPAQPQQPAQPQGRPSPRELLAMFRGLDPRERMELLGQLSGELDPELIREWMAANFGGEGEAVGS